MQVQTGVPELCAAIRERIESAFERKIAFSTFMEMALYHPQYGYYTVNAAQLGTEGDFVTSSHMGRDFAELLAKQFVDMWQRLDRPSSFHLVEMGAGQGLIADAVLRDIQKHTPDLLAALRYTLVETSPALRRRQQQCLESWQLQQIPISWCALEEIPDGCLVGCLFSNELVDAFPCHRVTLTEQGLQEQYVTLTENPHRPFEFVLGALSTPDLLAYFSSIGIDIAAPRYATEYTTEVNLRAIDWMTQAASKIAQGYLLTIDYGYAAERYYSPARSQGTLQCYTRHAHHDDPLINVGQQDITAHVDFTALIKQGENCGLETLGQAPQELFLMALGLGDRLNELSQLQGTDPTTISYALRRREALHQLMNPMGLGKFTVLVQGKGLQSEEQKSLKGLTVPPLM